MKICINHKKENITCGDLVYSKSADKYGFVACINESYYFIERNSFENWSVSYEDINELIENTKLELVAKNKELVIHTQIVHN